MSYKYENEYLWDIPRTWNIGTEPMPLRPRIRDMPRKGCVDFEAIIGSEYGEKLVTNMRPYILYEDEMGEDLLAYLGEIGLKKELFETENLYTKWALYTPASMYLPENKSKKYPLLFVNHGACMPIYWEENSGFLPIAAREEMIVISAQNHNEDNLMRILDIVCSKCAVDKSRIYCTGYSQGGIQTIMCTLRHPEIFAAAAPCGSPFSLPDFMLPEDISAAPANRQLPCVIVCGQEESLEYFPANKDNLTLDTMGPDRHSQSTGDDPTLSKLFDSRAKVIPSQAIDKIAMLNKKLRSIGHAEIPFDVCVACKDSDSEVERKHGFPADRTETITVLGVRHFISYFSNGCGQELLKVISIEGQPHWPPATMAELAWEFMRHFRRDTETKGLVVE
ncbi:MAG: prolyl oligopeptidase family serine peptidase [Oscillospiraceae bacterium]